VKHLDLEAIRTSSAARLAFLADFCQFTNADWSALDESVPYMAPRLPTILDSIYDQLLCYDDTRRIFLGARGELDPGYIELRKEHMTEWFMRTLVVEDINAFAEYVSEIGRRHTGVAGEPAREVPPRYMIALACYIQSIVLNTLFDMVDDLATLRRMVMAWNKIIIIQLELFLKEIAPAWPHWDEK